METKHTPGPWVAVGYEGLCVNALDPLAGECTLTVAAGRRGSSLAELKANAALIAAAPDMLAALKAASFWLSEMKPGDGVYPDEIVRVLADAIAKAEVQA
jgi:hypothetical protein